MFLASEDPEGEERMRRGPEYNTDEAHIQPA